MRQVASLSVGLLGELNEAAAPALASLDERRRRDVDDSPARMRQDEPPRRWVAAIASALWPWENRPT